MAFLGSKCSACQGKDNHCRSCKGSGLFMKASMEKRVARPTAAKAASEFDMSKVICYCCGKAGHMASSCPDQIAQWQTRQELRAARTLKPLEELEARKIDRKLREIECIREKVVSGAKVEASQLKKMNQKLELEQLPVMQKIADGWKRDESPQSELIQKITLTDEEEGHLRRFEQKLHKLTERQSILRAAVKVDHAQLESLQKEIDQLQDRDLFWKIAAGYRRATLQEDNKSKTLGPAKPKVHVSLNKAQPEKTHIAPQALEGVLVPVKCVSLPLSKLREVDECSEASTIDSVAADQVAALEKAAELLEASGLVAQAEELRKQAKKVVALEKAAEFLEASGLAAKAAELRKQAKTSMPMPTC